MTPAESVAFIRQWLAEGNQDEHYANLLAEIDRLNAEAEELTQALLASAPKERS